MVLNVKHRKNMPFTDEEINQYCDGVEKLLKKIKEDSLAKKKRKSREVIVEEEHIMADDDEVVLS